MRKFTFAILIIILAILPISAFAGFTLPAGVPAYLTKNGTTLDAGIQNGYLVYGTTSDVSGNEYKSGQYRYLGYDLYGNLFTNIDFPNDADSGRQPWEKSWISYPWFEGLCNKSTYNNDPAAASWLDGLGWSGWSGNTLINYLNIQSPPTDYTQGSAIGWHIDSGQTWYQTFAIQPKKTVPQATTGLYVTPPTKYYIPEGTPIPTGLDPSKVTRNNTDISMYVQNLCVAPSGYHITKYYVIRVFAPNTTGTFFTDPDPEDGGQIPDISKAEVIFEGEVTNASDFFKGYPADRGLGWYGFSVKGVEISEN
jgi:hypothetical protein